MKLLLPRWCPLALALVLLVSPGCAQIQAIQGIVGGASPTPAAPQGARAVTVSVQPVRQGPIALVLTYSGAIQPVQQLNIVPRTSGRIDKVLVDVGSKVKTGDKLVTLDTSLLDASVKQAEAGVAVAQARVDTIKAGARAEDIVQAEAAVASAKAKLAQVKAGPTASDIQSAIGSVSAAQYALQKAQTDLLKLKQTPTEDDLRAAKLEIEKQQNSLFAAQASRDGVCGNSRNAKYLCDTEQAKVVNAETALSQAQRAYDKVKAGPTAEDLAVSAKSVDNAQEQLNSAQAKLNQLRSSPTAEDIAIAQASVTTAEQQLSAKKTPYTERDLQTAMAQLSQAQGSLDSAKAQQGEAVMLAPFEGVILARNLGDGALTTAQSPILTLAAIQNELAIAVEEARISLVQPGQKVALLVAAYPQERFQAKIISIAPSADVKTHTFVVKVAPEDPTGRLRPGMFAEVKITAQEEANAVLVPKEAVVDRNGKSVAFVIGDGKAVMRELKLGLSDDTQVQAMSGVAVGESVAVAGQASLNDGDTIRIAGGAQPAGGQQPGQPGAKPQAPGGSVTPGAQPGASGTPNPARQKPDGAAQTPAATPAAKPAQ